MLDDEGRGPYLHAYRTRPGSGVRLSPAPSSRRWMDETTGRFANRCLPMKIANQAGWFVLNYRPVRATWDGSAGKSSVTVEPLDSEEPGAPLYCESHFGHGILTFYVPYLFKTPEGYNALARGPANWPKDGISPLEGIIETDWSVATFTMNWKFTRPDHPIVFEEGEPICMVVPQRRGELESFRPEVRDLNDDLEVAYDYWRWAESRWKALTEGKQREASGETPRKGGGYQRHYTRGTSPTGVGSEAHQIRLRLRRFEGAEE